jgi:hypothetical protein
MAWSASKIFMATLEDMFENTTAVDLNSDTFKAALYDNDITPDQTVTSANTAYDVGQWTALNNEVISTGEWDTGGVALASVTSSFSSNVYTFDAADTASGAGATISGAFGCLVYDDTIATPVANQGLCYNYFGGTQSVTGGLFTIVWNASGILAVTA